MRLILHAGTHKTGTSTIQRVLHDHRDAVREQGVHYPDPTPWFGDTYQAHHPVAHAFAHRGRRDLDRAREFLRNVADETADDETVLLSAEPIYRHVLRDRKGGWWKRHRAYLVQLAQELRDAGFDVHAVLVFRRRDEFVESLYHERVANGFGQPFAELLDNADRLLDYERQLRQFRAAFPRVQRLDYRSLAGDELVSSFLRAFGFTPPKFDDVGWDRRSTDARLSLWMAAAYAEDPDEELVTQRRRFAKNPVSDQLFEDFGRRTLWTDIAARRALLDQYGDHDPIDDRRSPAELTPEIETRIDRAFDEYLVAKGLSPTGRADRRSA